MSRMAASVLALTLGCSFEPGATIDAGRGGGSADAAIADGATPGSDAAVLPPDAASCTTNNLACAGNAVAIMCNGGCWVRCTLIGLTVPNQLTASLACAGWGGKLAPIRDAADQACVEQMLFPSQASWIGFEQSLIASDVDTDWSFNSDGVAVANPGWGVGQPNDQNGSENAQENCAIMNASGDWHDVGCADNSYARFSCRR